VHAQRPEVTSRKWATTQSHMTKRQQLLLKQVEQRPALNYCSEPVRLQVICLAQTEQLPIGVMLNRGIPAYLQSSIKGA